MSVIKFFFLPHRFCFRSSKSSKDFGNGRMKKVVLNIWGKGLGRWSEDISKERTAIWITGEHLSTGSSTVTLVLRVRVWTQVDPCCSLVSHHTSEWVPGLERDCLKKGRTHAHARTCTRARTSTLSLPRAHISTDMLIYHYPSSVAITNFKYFICSCFPTQVYIYDGKNMSSLHNFTGEQVCY